MGRIKSLQNEQQQQQTCLNGLFSFRYRKLVDQSKSEQSNNQKNNNSVNLVENLLRMKLSQDYIAYNCGQCGHHQRFDIKADELHSLVDDALRTMSCKNSSEQTGTTAVKNSRTQQFRDKSCNSTVQLVNKESNNLKETNKCKDNNSKPLIKGNGSALVMPFHNPLLMGYKPLLTGQDKLNNTSSSCSCHSSSSSSSSSSSDVSYLPTLPVRTDSLATNDEEETLLKCAPWFQAGIPREISLEILQQEPIGSFLVRSSTSKPGCYALSVRVPNGKEGSSVAIAHYLITQTNRGFKIKGFTKEFPSLTSLIVHHSVMPELLPCPLLLHRPSSGLLAELYLEHANNFVDIDSSILLELTSKSAE